MRDLVCFIIILIISANVNAQSKEQKYDPYKDPRNFTTTSVINTEEIVTIIQKDGCVMKDNILRCNKNNIALAIDRRMELNNGIIAFMNGVVFTQKGEIIRLKNGDAIDLNAVIQYNETKNSKL